MNGQHHQGGFSKPRAFTLVELLIVVAIIGILASLLLPALAGAKYHAGNAKCKSNLRQISLAVQMYLSSHGVFPPYYRYETPPLNVNPPNFRRWETKLDLDAREVIVPNPNPPLNDPPAGGDLGSLILGGVFQCPLNKGNRVTGWWQVEGGEMVERWRLPYNAYGYNAWGVDGGSARLLGLGGASFGPPPLAKTPFRFTRESAVTRPAEMIALGDIFLRSISPLWDGQQSHEIWGSLIAPSAISGGGVYTSPPQITKPKEQPSFKRHRGWANRAFADGHLESEDLRPQFRATAAALRRWNNDNEPHRELLRE